MDIFVKLLAIPCKHAQTPARLVNVDVRFRDVSADCTISIRRDGKFTRPIYAEILYTSRILSRVDSHSYYIVKEI